jgi:xylan 1,4-beta-xylosidase
MSRNTARVALALAASLSVRSAIAAPAAAVAIEVDARSPAAPLEHVWAYHGYDEANYTTTPEGEELLRALSAAHTAPAFVRTHFLFNTGDGTPSLKWGSTNIYTEDASGNPIYDYTIIDRIMDTTVAAGALPFVELGFMPQALSSRPEPYLNSSPYVLNSGCFYPPVDYQRWGNLVGSWAAHVKERYPGAETNWQWELWNEPDIGYWRGTFEEFARLYDHTEAALHAVLPGARFGGPAVIDPGGEFLRSFLEHCAAGTNAVSGATGTRLDLVSFHAKGGVTVADGHVRMNLGNQLRLHRSGFDAVAASAFARTPIVISEADPDGCAACSASDLPANAYRNTPAYGVYEVATMKHSLDLAAEAGVELRGVLTWAFTFPGTGYFGGYRVLATNGIHLPVLNAFKLLGSLSGARLPVLSSGARPLADILANGVGDQPDIDALAVVDGDRVRILIWNYHDDLVEADAASVSVTVSVPGTFGANAAVTHTRVDQTHGNAHAVWVSQGSPETPSSDQLAALREAMEPVLLSQDQPVGVEGGKVRLSLELPRFGLSLLTLSPSQANGSEAPAPGGEGCSCRSGAPARAPLPPLFSLALAAAIALAAQRASRSRRHAERPVDGTVPGTPARATVMLEKFSQVPRCGATRAARRKGAPLS